MRKKLILTFGTLTMTIPPIMIAVSCNSSRAEESTHTKDIDSVYQSVYETLKKDHNFELTSTLTMSEIDEEIRKEQGEGIIKHSTEWAMKVFNIGDFLPGDYKGVKLEWIPTKHEGPLGAIYEVQIRFSKSSGLMKVFKIKIKSKDHNFSNPWNEAILKVRKRLTDKIFGEYRSLLNATEIERDKLNKKLDKDDLELVVDGSFPDANAFDIDKADLSVVDETDNTNIINTTVSYEIRNTGSIINENGNTERKSFTVYATISIEGTSAVNAKSEQFIFTLNSGYYTAENKLEAEKDRLLKSLNVETVNGATVYKVGTTNDANRLILPSQFIKDNKGKLTNVLLGFDDSRRIFGTKYSYSFVQDETNANNDEGTLEVYVEIEATAENGEVKNNSADRIKILFVGFQSRSGAVKVIRSTIDEVEKSLSEQETHAGVLRRGKIQALDGNYLDSEKTYERNAKLPSEIYDSSTETSESLRRFIPGIMRDAKNDLVDIEFTLNKDSSDDIRGELVFDMKFTYSGETVSETIELVLTGFETKQSRAAKLVETEALIFKDVLVKEGIYLNLSKITPSDNQIIEKPTNSTAANNEQHEALYKELRTGIKMKNSSELMSVYFSKAGLKYEFIKGEWSITNKKFSIRVRVIATIGTDEFTTLTSEIELKYEISSENN